LNRHKDNQTPQLIGVGHSAFAIKALKNGCDCTFDLAEFLFNHNRILVWIGQTIEIATMPRVQGCSRPLFAGLEIALPEASCLAAACAPGVKFLLLDFPLLLFIRSLASIRQVSFPQCARWSSKFDPF
jgi:hypothetical protein